MVSLHIIIECFVQIKKVFLSTLLCETIIKNSLSTTQITNISFFYSLFLPHSLSPSLPFQYEGAEGRVVFRIDDGPPFQSVDDILEHYKLVADRLPCKLTDYCPRPPTRMTEC